MTREPANAESKEGPFTAQFRQFAVEIDAFNEKRERLVKASRDITTASKKLIFLLHRTTPSTRASKLSQAHKEAAKIRTMIAKRVASELDEANAPRFRRAFSPGLQEYVEARTFLAYVERGVLLGLDEVQKEVEVKIDEADYVLGVADLTGEVMRWGVALAGRSDKEGVESVWRFLREIEGGMQGLKVVAREFEGKMKVLKQSVDKVEKSCFDLTVRRAEFAHQGVADAKRRKIDPAVATS